MPIVRKWKDDRWYVWKRKLEPGSKGFIPRARKNVAWTIDWEVNIDSKAAQGRVRMEDIMFKPELLGKTVRFVVEVVEEAKK